MEMEYWVYKKMLKAAEGFLTAYEKDLTQWDQESLQMLMDAGGDEFLWALRNSGTHFMGSHYHDYHPTVTTYCCCEAVHKTWADGVRWYHGKISTGSLRNLTWKQVEHKAWQWDNLEKKRRQKGGAA